MVIFHDCLNVCQTFSLADKEVMENLPLALPSAEAFRILHRPDSRWEI